MKETALQAVCMSLSKCVFFRCCFLLTNQLINQIIIMNTDGTILTLLLAFKTFFITSALEMYAFLPPESALNTSHLLPIMISPPT